MSETPRKELTKAEHDALMAATARPNRAARRAQGQRGRGYSFNTERPATKPSARQLFAWVQAQKASEDAVV